MKNITKQLIELLNIHGVSGKETKVRDYLHPILKKSMDSVEVDNYGNLLATKKIGTGEGATVLLSAHMDTVKGVVKNRKLINKNGVISSSVGALGADDRAGIAIILTVMENIDKLAFDGTIKIAFSREEEIGCVGAGKIDPKFYEDANLAIVVDRRGNRDIVVGCWDAFCSDNVGFFMEDVAKMADMRDWKCVEGGISDATVFSAQGVNSINVSAGYMNEHTDKEYVVIDDMKDTVRLIMQALAVINTFVETFEPVGFENRWVKAYKPTKTTAYSSAFYGSGSYFEDELVDDVWAEEYDKNGDVFVYEMGMDCVIQQGDSEIVLSRSSLRNIIKQLGNI